MMRTTTRRADDEPDRPAAAVETVRGAGLDFDALKQGARSKSFLPGAVDALARSTIASLHESPIRSRR